MAENENPDIAVVLAKLEQEDAAAAEDAGAALEWIAGNGHVRGPPCSTSVLRPHNVGADLEGVTSR